jgi:hypothetical protein
MYLDIRKNIHIYIYIYIYIYIFINIYINMSNARKSYIMKWRKC